MFMLVSPAVERPGELSPGVETIGQVKTQK